MKLRHQQGAGPAAEPPGLRGGARTSPALGLRALGPSRGAGASGAVRDAGGK